MFGLIAGFSIICGTGIMVAVTAIVSDYKNEQLKLQIQQSKKEVQLEQIC